MLGEQTDTPPFKAIVIFTDSAIKIYYYSAVGFKRTFQGDYKTSQRWLNLVQSSPPYLGLYTRHTLHIPPPKCATPLFPQSMYTSLGRTASLSFVRGLVLLAIKALTNTFSSLGVVSLAWLCVVFFTLLIQSYWSAPPQNAWACLDAGYAVTIISDRWASLDNRITSQIAGAL